MSEDPAVSAGSSGGHGTATHPLERVTAPIMVLLAIAPLATFGVLRYVDTRLATDVVSSNLELQFAGNHARVAEIIESWKAADRMHLVGFAEGFDFLHLLLYPTAVAAGCAIVARRSRSLGASRAAQIGVALAWVGWAALPLDAAETLMTLPWLRDPSSGSPEVVWAVAALKFVCVGTAGAYAVGGALLTGRALRRLGCDGASAVTTPRP